MDMDSEARWREVERLFAAALELPAQERRAFIARETAGDPDLSEEVLALLRADLTEEVWDRAVLQWGSDLLPPTPQPGSPRTVGQFRLVRPLGVGGMGAVFLGEREGADFDQRVAVKLIRPDWNTPEVLRRFLAERRILAQLEHPGIARFIDGGVTDAGQPYFAMEYVEGEPIDRYCDDQRLGVRGRLRLFLEACAAVQHAHQNFIVHRDLKPSNILVTLDGSVKLLDFGIATVLAGEEKSSNTLFGAGVGTPFYMSPEQFRQGAITAASDVYSLGMLLFELLTGTTPYRITSAHPREIERAVLEHDPERPSTVIGWPNYRTHKSAGEVDAEEVSARRRTVPGRLRRTLRGDLDAIILKALDKEPNRRYASVQALADDVARYLSGHPVRAKRPSTAYRLSRVAKRHPWGIAAAVALAALGVGYVVTLSTQNARVEAALALAEEESQKSNAVSSFLLGLFRSNNPTVNRGELPTAAELLERGVNRAETMEDPIVRAELLHVLARTYRSMGRFSDALPPLQRAVAVRRQELDADDPDLAAAIDDLASVMQDLGDYDGALPLFKEALEIRSKLGPAHPAHLEGLNNLAVLYLAIGELEAAEPLLRANLAGRREAYGPDDSRVGVAINNLASLLSALDQTEEMEPLQRDVLRIWTKTQGPDHPDVALAMSNLALTLDYLEKFDESLSMHRQALALRQRVLKEDHPYVGISMNNLASSIEQSGGSMAEALALRREATALLEREYGPLHPNSVRSLGWLGLTLMAEGQGAEGEGLVKKALENAVGLDPMEGANLRLTFGTLLTEQARLAEAVAVLRGTVTVFSERLGADHRRTKEARAVLAAAEGTGSLEGIVRRPVEIFR